MFSFVRNRAGDGISNTVGQSSSILGGYDNLANGNHSTIGRGHNGPVSGVYDWLAGTLFEND